MNKKYKVAIGVLLSLGVLAAAVLYLRTVNIPVMEPKGLIGHKERNLIVFALLLSLVVVIPVYIMLFSFVLKYRDSNRHATYEPDFDHSRLFETIWWGVPALLILILSVVTWNSSHDLDPYKAINSNVKPLNVQVVSLDWKWLFIYPDQHIATVNYLRIPVGTPVNFEITSDTVMNSFWVPQLGGQIYAMPGMSTQLHLLASQTGTYAGSSANISGSGFAGMTFNVQATSAADFKTWARGVQQTPNQLDQAAYEALARPSKNNPVAYYSASDGSLYDTIVMKYMMPMDGSMTMGQMQGMSGMNMSTMAGMN